MAIGRRRLSKVVRFGMACRERCPLSRGGVRLPAGDRKVTCRIPVCLAWLGGRRRSPLVHLSLSISRSLRHLIAKKTFAFTKVHVAASRRPLLRLDVVQRRSYETHRRGCKRGFFGEIRGLLLALAFLPQARKLHIAKTRKSDARAKNLESFLLRSLERISR